MVNIDKLAKSPVSKNNKLMMSIDQDLEMSVIDIKSEMKLNDSAINSAI